MNASVEPQARYEQMLARLQGVEAPAGLDWVQQYRADATAAMRAQGIPNRKDEAWRYTSIEPLLRQDFQPAESLHAVGAEDLDELLWGELSGPRLVLVNGRVDTRLSRLGELPAGVSLGSLQQVLEATPELVRPHLAADLGEQATVFGRMNLAAMQDGALLHVPAGAGDDQLIEIVHVSVGMDEPRMANPRHVIVLEDGARIRLIERYVSFASTAVYFNNVGAICVLGKGASLEHTRVQNESVAAFHIHNQTLLLGEAANYSGEQLMLGGAWARQDLGVTFQAPGAQCRLSGLYLVGEGQLSDSHLDLRHQAPGCHSEVNYRGLLDGKGRGVFDGRILVAKAAQETDAHLKNDNLLLSRNAEIDTKPQLEIFADNVACSHGTTVGELDANSVFYLRSRGIPEDQARRMLCAGFARTSYQDCGDAALLRRLDALVVERLRDMGI